MRIGLDIDGVLAAFGEHFLDYLGFEDKTPPKHWDDPRFSENFYKIKDDINFWLTIPRLFDPRILDFNPVIYVTARDIPTSVTEKWLEINEFPKAPVVSVGVGGDKVETLKENVDIFVDDALHNYHALNEAGINCVLITRSHNEYEEVEKRIESINQVLNYE